MTDEATKERLKAKREAANRAELAKKRSKPYPSGNEGRLHPHLKHDGYFQGTPTRPPTDPALLERLMAYLKK